MKPKGEQEVGEPWRMEELPTLGDTHGDASVLMGAEIKQKKRLCNMCFQWRFLMTKWAGNEEGPSGADVVVYMPTALPRDAKHFQDLSIKLRPP